MKETSKRKEWVKNAAIIFLAVMLLLTLFSNTIMNYSLPEVSTRQIGKGRIEFEVKGTAIVKANDPVAVVTDEAREVAEVLARPGQAVKAGDVLMRLVPKESEELQTAKETLKKMEEAYQTRVISGDLWTEAELVESGTVPSYEEYKAQLKQLLLQNASAEYARLKAQVLAVRELQKEYEEILSQRQQVEELKAQQLSNEILAAVDGTVAKVYFQTGQTIPAGGTAALIQITDKGSTMTMTVDQKDAQRLSIGNEATFTGGYYRDLKAAIIDIRIDLTNPEKMTVEFSVVGNVVDGQSIALSVGARTTEYEHVVPNSALREDNNGFFVLILESKQSPLGTRYYARRADVSVVDSDETTSAVLMLEEGGGFVITTSSAPVEAGDMVRLAAK